jgi:large subunit ribosomal protein L17
MRHRVKTKKLNRNKAHRKALLRNLAKALILKQSIITTAARAKEAKRFTERLITHAMKKDGNAHRRIFKALADKKCVKKFFTDIVPHLGSRNYGHVRIIRTGQRKGDGAEMALLEFVFAQKKEERKEKAKGKEKSRGRLMPRLRRSKTKEKGKKEEEGGEEGADRKKAKGKEVAKPKREAKEKPKTRVKKEGKIRKKT